MNTVFKWGAGIALSLYAVLNTFAIYQGVYLFALLPVGLAMLAFALLRPEQFWLLLVFMTPFSFEAEIGQLQSSLALPNEPFIALFMVLLVFKFLLENKIDYSILKHPITVIIILQLLWMLVSAAFSTMPMVSFKYLLSRFWYVVVFYFFGLHVFKKYKRIDQLIWYFSLAMGMVILYSLIRHSGHHFSHAFSYKASLPFFKDHNIYAVIVAFFIPPVLIYALKGFALKQSMVRTMSYYALTAVFLVGVVASYTRAAWVSLGVALAFYAVLRLKIKLTTIITLLTAITITLFLSLNDIVLYMSKNKAESDSDLDAHVQSIYNVTSDDSNTERINRWSAALRMFEERPIVGFGPNTYQFQYAPYQLSRQKTKISTNLGNLGNAHSEFIGPLAEQGLLGALLVIALMLATLKLSMDLYYYEGIDKRAQLIGLIVALSFVTYYSHGLLNNYLDTDKANVVFWSFLAILVSVQQKVVPQLRTKDKLQSSS